MTALEARAASDATQDNSFNDEMRNIRNYIKSSTDKGHYSIVIYTSLKSNIRKALEAEGYEISIPRISENSRAEYEIKW